MISSQYGEKGLDIAREAYYTVFGKVPSIPEILEYLETEVSEYSTTISELDKDRPFNAKFYKEVTPEVLSKDKTNPSAFSSVFVRLLKEAYGL